MSQASSEPHQSRSGGQISVSGNSTPYIGIVKLYFKPAETHILLFCTKHAEITTYKCKGRTLKKKNQVLCSFKKNSHWQIELY